jgi:dihydrofolate reductase
VTGSLAAFLMVSLDGFHATPSGDLDWHNVDAEFHQFAVDQLDRADVLVFGRATYLGMAQFWPTDEAYQVDRETAERMNRMRKVVCSTTLPAVRWFNSSLIERDAAAALTRLKEETARDLLILGSATLIASMAGARVLDELRLMIAPVALGEGLSPFRDLKGRLGMVLEDVRRFDSGNVLLTYSPVRSDR